MGLFSSFKKLFDCFFPFWHRSGTQQCAAQELATEEKCSESEAFTAKPNKCRKKCRKGAKKCREVKALQNPARPTVLKPIKGKRPKLQSASGDFILPAARFKPLPPVKRPQMCPVEGPEQEFVLPGCPLYVDRPKLLAVSPYPVPAPDELFSHRFSTVCPLGLISLEEPQGEFVLPGCPLNVDSPKLPTVPPRPVPAPDELFSFRFSSVHPLRSIPVEELEHEFVLPGCPIQVRPPKQLPPRLVPAPDELFSTVCPNPPSRARAPLRSVYSLSSLSSDSVRSASTPGLMLLDNEDEESEFVENIQTFLKPERPRLMRQILAWEEEEDKDVVLDDESWTSEVFEFEDLSEAGDSEADHDIGSLFCVTPFDGAESKLSVNVLEEPQNRRKVPLILFSWAEEKVKQKVEKKLKKEREKRERELLHHRYRNDPKLKHLWINKHNPNYRWS